MTEDLENVLKERVKSLVDEATHRFFGVSAQRLSDDITAKLTESPLIEIEVDTHLGYKKAKNEFKKAFLTKLLLLHYGNISEVARITGKNRRSMHRLIRRFNINVKKIKKELIRPYDIKKSDVSAAIDVVLDNYRGELKADELGMIYQNMDVLSNEILQELPQPTLTFEAAQIEFEKRFFSRVLKENNHSISKSARRIGLRQETLHRKLKKLNMI